jgi:hypothetical protein
MAEAIDLYSKNFEAIFSAFIVLVLSFGTDLVEKNIVLPQKPPNGNKKPIPARRNESAIDQDIVSEFKVN